MTPEMVAALGEIGNNLLTMLNAFTDMGIQTKKRLTEAGWTEEGAEEFVNITVAPQAAFFLERILGGVSTT